MPGYDCYITRFQDHDDREGFAQVTATVKRKVIMQECDSYSFLFPSTFSEDLVGGVGER